MGSRMDARLSIAVVAAVFFAASAFPGISAGLEGYSPGHLALLRFLVASIVLAIYAVFSGIRLPAARDLPAVALAGFLAFSAYNVLLGYGQTSVPAGTASLLIASIPAFTALWAVAFLQERLGARGWAGIMVSFLGVALISFGKGEGFGGDPGALLVLLAAPVAEVFDAVYNPSKLSGYFTNGGASAPLELGARTLLQLATSIAHGFLACSVSVPSSQSQRSSAPWTPTRALTCVYGPCSFSRSRSEPVL